MLLVSAWCVGPTRGRRWAEHSEPWENGLPGGAFGLRWLWWHGWGLLFSERPLYVAVAEKHPFAFRKSLPSQVSSLLLSAQGAPSHGQGADIVSLMARQVPSCKGRRQISHMQHNVDFLWFHTPALILWTATSSDPCLCLFAVFHLLITEGNFCGEKKKKSEFWCGLPILCVSSS